jgi:hypothetical protein
MESSESVSGVSRFEVRVETVMDFNIQVGLVMFVSAVICAKWAMDLGWSQIRQVTWFAAGLLLGPLAMMILYVRLLSAAPESARRWL